MCYAAILHAVCQYLYARIYLHVRMFIYICIYIDTDIDIDIHAYQVYQTDVRGTRQICFGNSLDSVSTRALGIT